MWGSAHNDECGDTGYASPSMGDERAATVERLLAEGARLFEAGQADQAVAAWTEVLHLAPGEKRALAYLEAANSGSDDWNEEILEPHTPARAELEQLLAQKRYEEALELLYTARRRRPEVVELARGIQLLKQRLVRRYLRRLGNLDHVPRLVRPDVEGMPLSEEARGLLRLIDGISSFGDVAHESRLGRFETYRMLAQFVDEGLINAGPAADPAATPLPQPLPAGVFDEGDEAPVKRGTGFGWVVAAVALVASLGVVVLMVLSPAPGANSGASGGPDVEPAPKPSNPEGTMDQGPAPMPPPVAEPAAAPATAPPDAAPPPGPVPSQSPPRPPPSPTPARNRRPSRVATAVSATPVPLAPIPATAPPPSPAASPPIATAPTPLKDVSAAVEAALKPVPISPPPSPSTTSPPAPSSSSSGAPLRPYFEAKVAASALDVTGGLPRAVVERAIDRVIPGFRACYTEAAARAGHAAGGSMPVRLVIDETGAAREAEFGPGPLPGLVECVRGVARRIRSQAPDVGTAQVFFTLTFTPM